MMSSIEMGALIAALVGGVRARVGVERVDGWGVVALAVVCTALVYTGARWLPADVRTLVEAFVFAVGGVAVAKQLTAKGGAS